MSDWNHPDSTDEDRKRYAKKRNIILSMLKQCPQTTQTLTPVTHRFSCSIQELRQRGHKIKGERIRGGNWRYTYIGHDELIVIKKRHKNSYYQTRHWKAKRLERLEFDGNVCVLCHFGGDEDNRLHVHHWKYDLFGEDILDLSTLCHECHSQIHASVHIAFPKTYDVDTVNKMDHVAEYLKKINGKYPE